MSAPITGLGVANAAGSNLKTYWESLATGVATARSHPLFGEDQPEQQVMRVDDDAIEHGYARRATKRLDRFTLLASAAIRSALADADLAVGEGAQERIGILVGNCTGGWSYVEPQMYPLYAVAGPVAINPYVATAWFPTAPQGEVSIALELGGFSKTFCAENLSSAFALRQAAWSIETGQLDVAIVCGVEAPLTPLVYNACVRSGLVSPSASYQPYSDSGDGALLGEGAAAMVLESESYAKSRGARVQARHESTVVGTDRAALLQDADYIAVEARGDAEHDRAELGALNGTPAALGSVTGSSGALLGAHYLTSVITAALGLVHQAIPGGTRVVDGTARVGVNAESATLQRALALGTDADGQAGVTVLTKT